MAATILFVSLAPSLAQFLRPRELGVTLVVGVWGKREPGEERENMGAVLAQPTWFATSASPPPGRRSHSAVPKRVGVGAGAASVGDVCMKLMPAGPARAARRHGQRTAGTARGSPGGSAGPGGGSDPPPTQNGDSGVPIQPCACPCRWAVAPATGTAASHP